MIKTKFSIFCYSCFAFLTNIALQDSKRVTQFYDWITTFNIIKYNNNIVMKYHRVLEK
jgi:hypothetical protein